jgi:putative transposase
MRASPNPALHKRHRYPAEMIAYAVWRYFRFTLSYRDVEELLAARGISVSYETIRQWCRKFGQPYAKRSGGIGIGRTQGNR